MTDAVLYELDGHVATITYNRPDAMNAVNGAMRWETPTELISSSRRAVRVCREARCGDPAFRFGPRYPQPSR